MKKMMPGALCAFLFMACGAPKTEEPTAAVEAQPAVAAAPATSHTGATFADVKYVNMVKAGMDKFETEDIDGFLADYADNVVWQFNNGDSIAGKAAVGAYWKQRFADVIDSIDLSNHVWLALDVKNPQSIEQPGIWVLGWYMVNAKYKATGKRMVQWIHADSHFNADGKVDRVIQYLDRESISKAMKK